MAEVETASTEPAGELRPAEAAAAPLAEAVAIMARLRAPGGCPWDREQTFDSIKRHTLEETYEVFDAIERRAWPELKDELGDLLLQVLFYAQMAAEAGYFDMGDVAAGLNAKLVRRHPHVFPVNGELADAADANAVLRNWEQIKRTEKMEAAATGAGDSGGASGLDGIPRTMPAMLEAGKLGSRAAKVGFDWPSAEGIFTKLQEEIVELKAELADPDRAGQARVSEELGDLLFTAINLARHLKVDAESALRLANAKFRARFRAMEAMAGGYDALVSLSPEQLDALWNRAKRADEAGTKRSAANGPDSTAPDGSHA
jgi:XTP/dITP diphosphohydrolase/ATP diphosphatase